MKHIISISVLLILIAGCKSGSDNNYEYSDKPHKPQSDSLGMLMASPVIYDVIVKNPDTEDGWASEKLKFLDKEELVNIIFDAVYSGKLKAYNYHSGEEMSIKEIKELEESEEFDRSMIGKLQFEEDWYLDKERFTMYKDIKSILLAYERIDQFGEVQSYKAAFLIKIN